MPANLYIITSYFIAEQKCDIKINIRYKQTLKENKSRILSKTFILSKIYIRTYIRSCDPFRDQILQPKIFVHSLLHSKYAYLVANVSECNNVDHGQAHNLLQIDTNFINIPGFKVRQTIAVIETIFDCFENMQKHTHQVIQTDIHI